MRFVHVLLLLAAACVVGCDQGGSNPDPEAKARAEREAATRPAPKSAIALNDPLASYKRRAENGDVSAMLFLGRNYESLGASRRDEARKWYQMAADTGDESAKQSLAKLDAPPPSLTPEEPTEPVATADPTTAPVDLAPGVQVLPSATSRPTTTTGPVDLTKTRWQDVLDAVDTSDFVNVARDDYKPKGEDRVIFVGLSTAPDKTMLIAGKGTSANDCDEIKIAIRVRTRQNLAESKRVSQTAAVIDRVARNVTQREVVAWLSEYLSTGKRLEPIFRNGWQIRITGPTGEGSADNSKHLGEAIVVELKK